MLLEDNAILIEYECLISEHRHFITEFKLLEDHYISQNVKKKKL